jgi:beta-glucanase (GH16 family)
MRGKCLILLLTSVCLTGVAPAADPVPLAAAALHMQLTFDESFHGPLSWCSEVCNGQRWRTKFFHSGDTPLSRGLGMSGADVILVDPGYLGLGINPFSIADGTLTIEVRPASQRVKDAVHAAYPPWWHPQYVPRFTAGHLSSEKSFLQRYGYFEAKIKIPDVPGTWPAFWLFSRAGSADEIDVMEVLGGRPTQQHIGHNWGTGGEKHSAGTMVDGLDLSKAFHVFGVLWTKDTIAYYRDDVEIAHFSNPGLHAPMYILAGIGMDGTWNEEQGFRAPDDARADMAIQWIRAYGIPD